MAETTIRKTSGTEKKEKTANEKLRDALVENRIYARWISNDIRRRVILEIEKGMPEVEYFILKNFRKSEAPVIANQGIAGVRSNIRDTDKKLQQLRKQQEKRWEKALSVWDESLKKALDYNTKEMKKAIQDASPYKEEIEEPSNEELAALLALLTVDGLPIEKLFEKVKSNHFSRLESLVKLQVRLGASADDIAAAVTNNNTGIIRKTLSEMDTIANSSMTQIFTTANDAAVRKNSPAGPVKPGGKKIDGKTAWIFGEEVYTAVLDNRTTKLCRSLHGTTYPIGEAPRPPLHYNCRSIVVPLFEFRGAEMDTLKDSLQRKINDGFMKKYKLTPEEMAKLGTPRKRLFNEYATSQVKAAIGKTPSDVNFGSWLSGVPKSVQRKVLGEANYNKYRAGRKVVIQYKDQKARYVNVDNLERSKK